jgi:hypothetical protein
MLLLVLGSGDDIDLIIVVHDTMDDIEYLNY